jgi:hypothetical protein
MNDKELLIEELLKAANQTRNFGWRNYACAYIMAWVAVAGSIAATILAAVQVTPSWLTAIIAAIPAAVLAVDTTFNFERKAIWHWRTTKRFEGLIRKLRYENAEEAEVSKEFSEIDLDTFDGWIAYSSLSKEKESIEKKGGNNQ